MKHVLNSSEWHEQMALKILGEIRNELYLDMRYLDMALSALHWESNEGIRCIGTDGERLYYSAEHLIRLYPKNPAFLNREYLHTVLHCIFSHLWIRHGRDREMWNIACDVTVEYTIDHVDKPCVKRAVGWIRQQMYERISQLDGGVSASAIYNLIKTFDAQELNDIQREFYTDSHLHWPKEEKQSPSYQSLQNKWDKISRQTDMDMSRRGSDSDEGENLILTNIKADKGQRSYRDFLKKFAVIKEEMHCNEDEFDMNYYTYGLKLYGNMPLIEPLESREVKKILDFIIVIDTSYSTSGDMVKDFIRETFGLLSQETSFFKKCNIRIIQCDDRVRLDRKITDMEELDKMLEDFELTGGGNTDFRPAFEYVNRLVADGSMKNLKGLLYFTDGLGIYPTKRPPYDTVFVFSREYDKTKLPPWAMGIRYDLI